MGKLQDIKLRKEMGHLRPDSGTAVLPEGRVLVKHVVQTVRAWSVGDARKSKDIMNCSMWQALLPQLCADEDALQKGEAGYKQWLQPDEAVTETVEGYLERLSNFADGGSREA
eukprot:jgi/Tetstr1/421265/TSEL_001138.t1